MGYAGYVEQRERARALRAQAWTLAEIAAELGVARSSVSVWCREVQFEPKPRNRGTGAGRKPHRQLVEKLEQIERLRLEAVEQIGMLSERDLLIAGVALYAGEGAKTSTSVKLANSDPRMIRLFLRFLRAFFPIDESRLRMKLYLHEGLDLQAAVTFWSELTAIPPQQFTKPYRAAADQSIRRSKHPMGCPAVCYSDVTVLRTILALGDALLS